MTTGNAAGWLARGWRSRPRLPAATTSTDFGLVVAFYQREPLYSLGLAALSAYAKQQVPGVRVHLVPIFPHDSPDDIRDVVARLGPSLIAASAMSPTWTPLVPHLRALKGALPSVPIVVGGYQGIVSPAATLAEPAVDFVCPGDGEQPLVDLIRRLRGEADARAAIAGLWEKRPSGEIVSSPAILVHDLAAMPLPDYSIFEHDGAIDYLKPHAVEARRLTSVPTIAGRGCPYRCSYCANTTLLELHGGKGGLLRKYRTPELVAGLAEVRDRYEVDFFQFWDEEFLYDAAYARDLLPAYRNTVATPFSMFVRVENMTDDLCRSARAGGCHSMWFGCESGSEEYRARRLNRRMSNARIVEAAETARRHGLKLFMFCMVGMPFESRAHVDATLDLCRRIRPELTVFSQYVPLPGTPLYELCREHELLDDAIDAQMWPIGTLNLREHDGALTADEMREVGEEIMDYLRTSTRVDE